MILDYFLGIYSTEQPNTHEVSVERVTPRISLDMNNKPLDKFKEDEVRIALKQMHPTKTPKTKWYVPNLLSKILGCSRY